MRSIESQILGLHHYKGRILHEGIRPRITNTKAALTKKQTLLTSKLDLKLRKKLLKCYIWSIVDAAIGREDLSRELRDVEENEKDGRTK